MLRGRAGSPGRAAAVLTDPAHGPLRAVGSLYVHKENRPSPCMSTRRTTPSPCIQGGLFVPLYVYKEIHPLPFHVYKQNHPFAQVGAPQLRALAEELRAEHIHVSIRGSALRISPHLWAGERDVERLFDAIARREELL